MVEESYLSIAVRAYTVRGGDDAEPLDTAKRGRRSMHDPRHVLVFDTETTTDLSQRLNFGCWRYYRVDWAHGVPSMSCVEEGFFYADDLPTRDPEGFEQLTKFVESHGPDVARRVPDAAWRLRLVSAREFVDEVLIPVAYRRRAWVVGFNLSFDLSRLAYGWGLARGRSAGGISLQLAQYDAAGGVRRENRFKPRVAIQTIDSKRQLIGFTRPSDVDLVDELPDDPGPDEDERQTFRGHFLDLRTLAFALTNEGYTLDSACRDFGVEFGKQEAEQHGEITESYLAYNRADVCATAGLFERLMTEFKHHPIGLQATKAFSPASVGKAYLRAMGITPILKREPQVPPAVLGKGMVAYYGGRAECRIRRTPVPVAYCDFLSMYPTVCCLMGLWKLVTAQSIQPVEQDPGEIQAWIDRLSVEDCFNSATWKHFVGLVQVEARGEILPVRAQYTASPSWGIGVNPLTHEQEDLWFTIPDLIAAKVLGGRAPRISKAMTLERVGRLPNLKPVALGGQITIDPRSRDFFQAVVEERHALKHRTDLPSAERDRLRAFLKVLANSSSYGIYAEMVRHHLRRDAKETVTVHGLDDKPFKDRVAHPESPGEFSFPPIAACITGAARLMLALTEKLVTDQGGGTYAFCDTDSMAIVATETGGPVTCPGGPHQTTDGREAIQALSWDQVENIRARFQGLNPYNRAVIPGSVLELEDQNYTDKAGKHRRQLYCFSISAKRYVLYEHAPNGQPVIRKEGEADGAGEKWSKHGLGHLLNPTDPESPDRDWIRQIWETDLQQALNQPHAEPTWLDRPAAGGITASKPATLLPFRHRNKSRPYSEQVKPFNFVLSAHLTMFGYPPDVDPAHFHLIAPWDSDSRNWAAANWVNKYEPGSKPFRLTTTETLSRPGLATAQTYRDVLGAYRVHPEAKSLASNGSPCGWHTTGLMQRRPVTAITTTHVGKESNGLDDTQAGIVHDPDEVLTDYGNRGRNPFRTVVLPVLASRSRKQLRDLGLSGATIGKIRDGSYRPYSAAEKRLTRAAGEHAREVLSASGAQVNGLSDHGACYLIQ